MLGSIFCMCILTCAQAQRLSGVGMNLEQITYYSQGTPFKNRFLGAMPFISQNATSFRDPRPLSLDSNGYPVSLLHGQYAGSLLLDITATGKVWHYNPQGIHVFTYDGICSPECCQFNFNAKVVDSSVNGTWKVNISYHGAGSSVEFQIKCIIDSSDYPRNFSLIPQVWYYYNRKNYNDWDPNWIASLNYTNFEVLRFMDWLQTNGSPNKHWQNRMKITNYTQATKYGIAMEYIIDLIFYINSIQSERYVIPWINIPHLADDNYIENLALLWKTNYFDILNYTSKKQTSFFKLIVEYSNECWNPSFACYNYMKAQANNISTTDNININNYEYYGTKVCDVRSIFDNVFKDTSFSDEIYFVMGTQAGNTWITGKELSYNYNKNGFTTTSQCVNGVAMAQYYCMYNMSDEQVCQSTIDELFENILSNKTRNYYKTIVKNQVTTSNQYTGYLGNVIDVVGYEGSWGCTPSYGNYRNNLTIIYNNMVENEQVGQTVYNNVYDFMAMTNNSLFNFFNHIGWAGQYGDWGHLQFQDSYFTINSNNQSYKWQGIEKFLSHKLNE